MKRSNDGPTYPSLWKSNKLKSLLGLFVGISIIAVYFWIGSLPSYVLAPALAIYSFFVISSMKLIFRIDSRLKTDKDYGKIIEKENKTVRTYEIYFIILSIGSVFLLKALDKPIFEFDVKMRIFSITTLIITLTYLIFLWMYYKHILQKK